MSTLKEKVMKTHTDFFKLYNSDDKHAVEDTLEAVCADLNSIAYCMFKLSYKLDRHIIDQEGNQE